MPWWGPITSSTGIDQPDWNKSLPLTSYKALMAWPLMEEPFFAASLNIKGERIKLWVEWMLLYLRHRKLDRRCNYGRETTLKRGKCQFSFHIFITLVSNSADWPQTNEKVKPNHYRSKHSDRNNELDPELLEISWKLFNQEMTKKCKANNLLWFSKLGTFYMRLLLTLFNSGGGGGGGECPP